MHISKVCETFLFKSLKFPFWKLIWTSQGDKTGRGGRVVLVTMFQIQVETDAYVQGSITFDYRGMFIYVVP